MEPVEESFCHQTSSEMDLREMQKLLDEDHIFDEDQADMLKAEVQSQ